MSTQASGKMSVVTVSMLIVVTTFGLANVIDNLVELGLAAIPSWVLVGFLYFLPLALILAEFASDTTERGGIYSYMERGLGPTWAFVGTWSYFVANLVYLQSAFSKLPIRVSLAVSGEDAFETATLVLPLLAVAICVAATYLSTRGVRSFSHLSNWGRLAAPGQRALVHRRRGHGAVPPARGQFGCCGCASARARPALAREPRGVDPGRVHLEVPGLVPRHTGGGSRFNLSDAVSLEFEL